MQANYPSNFVAEKIANMFVSLQNVFPVSVPCTTTPLDDALTTWKLPARAATWSRVVPLLSATCKRFTMKYSGLLWLRCLRLSFPQHFQEKVAKKYGPLDHFLKNKNTILPFKKNKTTSFLGGLLQYFSTPILRKPLDWHHGRIPIVVLQGLRSLAAWKRKWHLPTSMEKVVKNWWNLKTWHVKFGLYLPARAFFAI